MVSEISYAVENSSSQTQVLRCTCTELKILLSYRSRVLLEGSTVGRNTQRPAFETGPRPFKITVLHKHKSCACTCTESKTLLSYRSRVLLEGSTVGRNTQRPAFEAGPRTFEVSEFYQTRWINSSPQSQVLRCTCTEPNTLLSYWSRVFFFKFKFKICSLHTQKYRIMLTAIPHEIIWRKTVRRSHAYICLTHVHI